MTLNYTYPVLVVFFICMVDSLPPFKNSWWDISIPYLMQPEVETHHNCKAASSFEPVFLMTELLASLLEGILNDINRLANCNMVHNGYTDFSLGFTGDMYCFSPSYISTHSTMLISTGMSSYGSNTSQLSPFLWWRGDSWWQMLMWNIPARWGLLNKKICYFLLLWSQYYFYDIRRQCPRQICNGSLFFRSRSVQRCTKTWSHHIKSSGQVLYHNSQLAQARHIIREPNTSNDETGYVCSTCCPFLCITVNFTATFAAELMVLDSRLNAQLWAREHLNPNYKIHQFCTER